jgi:hypothetical protein
MEIAQLAVATTLEHPNRVDLYETALNSAKTNISKSALTFGVYVNDPIGKLEEIFISFCGHIFNIKATNYRTVDPSLTYKVWHDNTLIYMESISLIKFFETIEARKIFVTDAGQIMFISDTKANLNKGIRQYRDHFESAMGNNEIAALVKKIHLEEKAKFDATLIHKQEEFELFKSESNFKAQQLQHTIRKQEASIEDLKIQVERWKSYFNADLDVCKLRSSAIEETTKTQRTVLNHQTTMQSAILTQKTEETKYTGVWLKTLGGAVLAFFTWAVTFYIRNIK